MTFKKHTIAARILRNYIHDPDPNGYSCNGVIYLPLQ